MDIPASAQWQGVRAMEGVWLPQAAALVGLSFSRGSYGLPHLWAYFEIYVSHAYPVGGRDHHPILACAEICGTWTLPEADFPAESWALRDALWYRWP